ncbi:MAG: ATP-binding protein, partial [bacterium]
SRARRAGTIVIRQYLDDPSDPVAIGPVRIHEIVLNLILNARDALARTGGVIDVKLESVETGAKPAGNGDNPEARRYARVTVCDNGPGLPAEIVTRMFESSASVTSASAPYPLDLSAVNHLVRECGGSVTVHNRIGKGTSFHIFLPATAPENNA